MELNLESLGLTKERIIDLVVEKIVGETADPNEEAFFDAIQSRVEEAIKAKVASIFESQVLTKVSEMVESIQLRQTNRWGEPKEEPLTFVEYLTAEATRYINEPVNWSGKSKQEEGSFSFSAKGTRLAYMIHQHLHHQIEQAVKATLADANSVLAKAITDTVQIKLDEVRKAIKIDVETR